FAWIQHIIHHLAPQGMAGFVSANGAMSSNQSGEGEIRKNIIESDLVDCMVALPGQLFYTTPIPVCLWFIARDKADRRFRSRPGETLFIDARKMGTLIDRVHRELSDHDIAKIVGAYHAWRGDGGASVPASRDKKQSGSSVASPHQKYKDIAGFCKSAKLDEIRAHGHVLTPGRYVGAEQAEDDGEPFERKMKRLTAALEDQFAESARLEKAIRENLKTFSHVYV
ncbi:MAG: SAM-dependent DNA methyltransferase, partial [Verrucomicrobia bacterium]|nr:SAM-dependent DNA methyltransferase [Verrucomicrobiota bacterium]